ncbi:nucleoside monophosphate kinase [Streptomyces globosus]|nr:nucleoside monophosphate kinase [Streptomyces globosus]
MSAPMGPDEGYERALGEFAAALVDLRINHGAPTYKQLSKAAQTAGRTSLSSSAISEAMNGVRLPSMEFTLELVRQIAGHDPQVREAWRERWTRVRRLQRRGTAYRARPERTSPNQGEGQQGFESPPDGPRSAALREAAEIVAQARVEAEVLIAEAQAQADEILRAAEEVKKSAVRDISPAVARLMTRESMRIILLGPPGAGKGTQGMYLKRILGVPKVQIGDLMRENISQGTSSGLLAKQIMDRGDLIPDGVFMDMLRHRLSREDVSDGFLLDGLPRTVEQSQMLDSLVDERGHKIDIALHLDISRDEAVRRISGRRICKKDSSHVAHVLYAPPQGYDACRVCGGGFVARADDSRHVVKNRWAVWEAYTEPTAALYGARGQLVKVSGYGSVDEVTERAVDALAAFFG